jgi:multidrug efflux pump subunit AcrA (membrane-fusion protein)
VLITEGNFIPGDSITVYRDEAYSEKQRLGRGSVSRVNPTAVNATGAIVSIAVKDGDRVKRGDLLMEKLSGTFEGYEMTGTAVVAAEEGVIVSVSAEVGATVSKGDVVAQIAPISGMRVEAAVGADDRLSLKAGDKVTIELESDDSITYEGTVRYITEMPEEDAEEVTYKAVIDFTPDENVYFGMAVVVTSGENSATINPGE